ncbi:MAG: D-alanine--D-alanine ligase [Candidatus Omnitrophica bacterium]|nr:D-alanine--D-alanine ligase [Candidatus Omnitrophota bacterium]
MRKYGRVGVLMGGYSSEREISLKSGQAICTALQALGCEVIAVDIVEHDDAAIARCIEAKNLDLGFIALHGRLGEDGQIQRILEQAGIPYTGSGVEASQTAIHKIRTKNVLRANGINVAEDVTLSAGERLSPEAFQRLGGYPLVVKPLAEGSSIGVSLAEGPTQFEMAVEEAGKYGPQIMVEKYISGREITVGILGKEALPVVEICASRTFFDYTAKYQKGLTDYIVPARLDELIVRQVQAAALKAHEAVGCEDISRVDMIIDDNGRYYVLEINTIPGFTATSLLPQAAAQRGINFNQLCAILVDRAYGKKEDVRFSRSPIRT